MDLSPNLQKYFTYRYSSGGGRFFKFNYQAQCSLMSGMIFDVSRCNTFVVL